MRNIIKVVKANYIDNFKCLKGDCEDTCCAGWGNISVDHETYIKYFEKQNFNISELVKKKIIINESANSEIFYANFILNSDSSCPFLTGKKLCMMQLEMGENYLPFICSIYPRAINIVNGVVEESAVLSCPETARLILLNPKGIGFKIVEEENHDPRILKYAFNISEFVFENISRYFTELRKFAIRIIKDRRHCIEERIIMLGYFIEDIQKISDNREYGKIKGIMDLYMKKLDINFIHDEMPIKAGTDTFKMKILMPILINKLNSGISNKRFSECLNEFLKGIEFNDNKSNNSTTEAYAKAYDNYYYPFMKQHEYIYENYLVNYIFKNLFPMEYNGKIYEKYIILILNYLIIKMLLVGISGYNKMLTAEFTVKLIQSYTKIMEYDYESFKICMDHIIKNVSHGMDYLQMLIKG